MRNARTRLVAASCVVFALVPGLAAANSWTWRDRDDQDRALSIQEVTASHGEYGPAVTVTFDRALRLEKMGEKDFVVLLIDSDGKAPNEEWAYFVAVDGQLQRFSYNPHNDETSEIDESTFSLATPESLEIQVTRFAPGEGHVFAAGTYTESAAGCAKGCWDWAPNRGGLIHDWTPPWVHGVSEPSSWTYQRTLPFYWEASDVGLSGFRRSSLMMSESGSGKWRAVVTRKEPGRYKVLVRPLNQGSNVMLRPVALDGAGNKTIGPVRRIRVPWDQGNPNGPGTLTGAWQEEMTHAFGGTVHVSNQPGDSLTFPGTANLYCFQGSWGPVRATFDVGGETVEIDTISSSPTYHDGYPTCIDVETVEERTATLTVHEGDVTVDWYWAGVYPAETETATEQRESRHALPAPSVTLPKARIKSVSASLSRS